MTSNRSSHYETEESPLLRPMKQATAGALCTASVVGILAIAWCVLDFWNHELSSDLFNLNHYRKVEYPKEGGLPQVAAPYHRFAYPLTLAFMQFAFMGLVFLCLYMAATQEYPSSLRELCRQLPSDRRWSALVVSHVCSVFWLQSLMMPTQVMSLGLFAATRAVEIPVVGAMRAPFLGKQIGGQTIQTTVLAFLAACTLYYSYAELAGCVCILSGHGVALTGVAFWVIYGLILSMPAVNAVCQEALLLEPGMHPLLLLSLQNIFAALLVVPIMMIAYIAGWENVNAAFSMTLSHQSVLMLVVWLCAQMSLTSVVSIMIIQVVDSFWAIGVRALRVVLWALVSLPPGMALSIVSPRQSLWAFMICCGTLLAGAAIYTDRRAEDDDKAAVGGFEKGLMKASA